LIQGREPIYAYFNECGINPPDKSLGVIWSAIDLQPMT